MQPSFHHPKIKILKITLAPGENGAESKCALNITEGRSGDLEESEILAYIFLNPRYGGL